MPHDPFPHPGRNPFPGGQHPFPFPVSGRWDVIQNGVSVVGTYPSQMMAMQAIASGIYGVQSPTNVLTVVEVA
jgi:hypothetical protein